MHMRYAYSDCIITVKSFIFAKIACKFGPTIAPSSPILKSQFLLPSICATVLAGVTKVFYLPNCHNTKEDSVKDGWKSQHFCLIDQ